MRKTFGMNTHQKAAHKVGERKSSAAEVADMLALSCSSDADDRLLAAQHLCPCHVRKRIDAVWDALFHMMEDADARVRQAAWHTLEDGGVPTEPAMLDNLERLLKTERDPKVHRFAEHIIGPPLRERENYHSGLLTLPGRPQRAHRGKCDFCGADGVQVDFEPETPIPTTDGSRPAFICEHCAQT